MVALRGARVHAASQRCGYCTGIPTPSARRAVFVSDFGGVKCSCMLPSNILFRTFFIRSAMYGTAFTIDVEGEEYLFTARHLLDTGSELLIHMFRNRTWLPITAKVIAVGRGDLDVAALKLPVRLTPPEFTVTPTMGSFFVGQDMYFVGFPYKMWADYGAAAPGLAGPYLKKGALSSVDQGPPRALYVDAINNEGFSGGPLYYLRNNNPLDVCVAGVVSGFRIEREPVVRNDGTMTDLSVAYNTGFLIAYDIEAAVALVKSA
jgi:Trypsin-like peptidase domain